MIRKSAQNKIKKELSKGEFGYQITILKYLKKHEIYTKKGVEFSKSMIRLMLNTSINHSILEKAIYNCFEEEVNLRNKEEERRKNILNQNDCINQP